MANLDKVYSTWENLDVSYEKSGNGISRGDYLFKLLGAKDGTFHTEQLFTLIKKDFEETPQNVERLNFLQEKIQLAKQLAGMLREIEILNFEASLQQLRDGGSQVSDSSVFEFNPEDYRVDTVSKSDALQYAKDGFLLPGVYENGAGVVSICRSDGKGSVSFLSEEEIIKFVLDSAQEMSVCGSLQDFKACVLAYLVRRIVANDVQVPIVFVSKNSIWEDEDSVCFKENPDRRYKINFYTRKSQDTVKLLGGASYDLTHSVTLVCEGYNRVVKSFPLVVVGGVFRCH